jgi:nifR3 family TIM-barrel protein
MMNTPEHTFHIGSIPVHSETILSPMDGYSDLPFRGLCRQLGSAVSYTEFINAGDVLNGRRRHLPPRLVYEEFERPVAYQIYDDDPERILHAVRLLLPHNPDIIDINMGCSEKKISNRGAGAGLLRTPGKIAQIFSTLSDELDIPVTGKIRIGWDEENLNYLEIAHIIEDNGGQLVAIHGRTRMQGYGGEANWDPIAEVKQAVSIPVIGNGDVKTTADIARMQAHTGCDAVMIGRAAIGNPWIFSGLDRGQVAPEMVRETMLNHLQRSLDFYGEERGLVLFRKHATRYLNPYPLPNQLRRQLLTAEQPEQFIAILDQIQMEAPRSPTPLKEE